MGDLKALAAFAARLSQPGVSFGAMGESKGKGTAEDPAQFPYWVSTKLADDFVKMAYDAGWVDPDLNWPEWLNTVEAQSFVTDAPAIATANAEQLRRLLTAIIRSDRFREGAILEAFEDGMVGAVVARAQMILRAM